MDWQGNERLCIKFQTPFICKAKFKPIYVLNMEAREREKEYKRLRNVRSLRALVFSTCKLQIHICCKLKPFCLRGGDRYERLRTCEKERRHGTLKQKMLKT